MYQHEHKIVEVSSLHGEGEITISVVTLMALTTADVKFAIFLVFPQLGLALSFRTAGARAVIGLTFFYASLELFRSSSNTAFREAYVVFVLATGKA